MFYFKRILLILKVTKIGIEKIGGFCFYQSKGNYFHCYSINFTCFAIHAILCYYQVQSKNLINYKGHFYTLMMNLFNRNNLI